MRIFLIVLLLLGLACMGPSEVNTTQDEDRLDRIASVYNLRKTKTAIILLEDYVADYPKDDLAWTILGHAYNDLDQADEAKAAYETALKLNPKRAEATTGLGIWHRKRREYDLAMAAYQNSVKLDPTFAQAYSSMAIIALKQLKDAEAVVYAEKGYALEPTDPVIVANLAIAYHYNGEFEKRDQKLQEARSIGYSSMDALEKIVSGETTIRD